MVNYNVKGTGLDITDEIRTYIEKKFSHVDKYLDGDSTKHADVELQYQTSEDRQKWRAEFTFSTKGEVYRAEALGGSLHEAIDVAISELNHELSKHRKRGISRVRHGAAKFKDFIRGFRRDV
jgi:putative sigma-54 modulation protein